MSRQHPGGVKKIQAGGEREARNPRSPGIPILAQWGASTSRYCQLEVGSLALAHLRLVSFHPSGVSMRHMFPR